MAADRYTVAEEGFSFSIPAGWQAERDAEEGGVDVWNPDGPGDLHLVGFPAGSADAADPAEELYAFLEEQEIELEEDEIDDHDLDGAGEMAVCEYISEDEETGEAEFWLVGVAALPGSLVFAHYICAAGREQEERDAVRELLRSIRAVIGKDEG
jgi:hypothetical protein